jgi:formylglycine-generating enzyme required for sulfatase activity
MKVKLTNPALDRKGPYRVYRGGSWLGYAWIARASYRYGIDPSDRDYGLGFRLVKNK